MFQKFKKKAVHFLLFVLLFFIMLFGVYPSFRNSQWHKNLLNVKNVEALRLAQHKGYKTILI